VVVVLEILLVQAERVVEELAVLAQAETEQAELLTLVAVEVEQFLELLALVGLELLSLHTQLLIENCQVLIQV
jgi:hypothetical protein